MSLITGSISRRVATVLPSVVHRMAGLNLDVQRFLPPAAHPVTSFHPSRTPFFLASVSHSSAKDSDSDILYVFLEHAWDLLEGKTKDGHRVVAKATRHVEAADYIDVAICHIALSGSKVKSVEERKEHLRKAVDLCDQAAELKKSRRSL